MAALRKVSMAEVNKTTVDIPRTVGSCFGGCFGWFAILFLVGGALYVLGEVFGSLSGGVVLWGVIIGGMIFYGGKEVYRRWNRVS